MLRLKLTATHLLGSLLLTLGAVCPVPAQGVGSVSAPTVVGGNSTSSLNPDSAPIVTAVAANERVRFTAPSSVVQLRLEVLADTGQVLFDAQSKGDVFDWAVQDGSGQRLADGTYLYVVTTKKLSGRVGQRIGSLQLSGGHFKL